MIWPWKSWSYTVRYLTRAFCTYDPNLGIKARAGPNLSPEEVSDWHTDRHTEAHKRRLRQYTRPKLASGKKAVWQWTKCSPITSLGDIVKSFVNVRQMYLDVEFLSFKMVQHYAGLFEWNSMHMNVWPYPLSITIMLSRLGWCQFSELSGVMWNTCLKWSWHPISLINHMLCCEKLKKW